MVTRRIPRNVVDVIVEDENGEELRIPRSVLVSFARKYESIVRYVREHSISFTIDDELVKVYNELRREFAKIDSEYLASKSKLAKELLVRYLTYCKENHTILHPKELIEKLKKIKECEDKCKELEKKCKKLLEEITKYKEYSDNLRVQLETMIKMSETTTDAIDTEQGRVVIKARTDVIDTIRIFARDLSHNELIRRLEKLRKLGIVDYYVRHVY